MSKKIVGILIFLVLVVSSVTSYGAINAKGTLTPSTAKIAPGDEVVITLSMSDITGDLGISKFKTVLKYDKNIFEQVKQSNVESTWTISYVENQELLTLETTTPIKSGTNILTLTLKAKSAAPEGTTIIEFTESSIHNVFEDEDIIIAPLSITIEKASTPITSPSSPPTSTPPTGGNTNTNGLPQTGIEDEIVMGLGVIGIISAIVSGIWFLKMRDI